MKKEKPQSQPFSVDPIHGGQSQMSPMMAGTDGEVPPGTKGGESPLPTAAPSEPQQQ